MAIALADLPGLTPTLKQALHKGGLVTTRDLIRAHRQDPALIQRLGLTPREYGKLLALSTLAEVPGVGCRYCGLLLHIGIRSPQDLSRSRPEQLQRSILRLHRQLGLQRHECPSGELLGRWVAAARQLH
jgi:Domain of unknown function (DUF4332)